MITDLSDLLKHLEVPGSSLSLEFDESLRAALRSALLAGPKHSLQHPGCSASPKGQVEFSKLEFSPDNGNAYCGYIESFNYQNHQLVAIERDLVDQATGWFGYISNHNDSRAYALSLLVEKALVEQEFPEMISLPLSLIHEIADWVQSIMRNDTNALGRKIRKSVKEATGPLIPMPTIPAPFNDDEEDHDK